MTFHQDQGPAWNWFNHVLGAPRFICPPMVRQSDLVFRLLCRQLGCHLCFTPMLPASHLVQACREWPDAIHDFIRTNAEDRPLIAQIQGNDKELLAEACRLLGPYCDGIDLNLGCPQSCAKVGKFGAYLLEDADLIESLVVAMVKASPVPVSCKIRLLPTLKQTLELSQRIERAGCSMLTVHGRLREQSHHQGAVDWDAIRSIREWLRIPVIGNGGIRSRHEADEMIAKSGCNGVMAATALLADPSVFNHEGLDLLYLAKRYLELAQKYPPIDKKSCRDRILTMFWTTLRSNENLDLYGFLQNRLLETPEQVYLALGHFAKRIQHPMADVWWPERLLSFRDILDMHSGISDSEDEDFFEHLSQL